MEAAEAGVSCVTPWLTGSALVTNVIQLIHVFFGHLYIFFRETSI
jgi:hypothetical protein